MTKKPQNTEYFHMNSAETLDASFGVYKNSFWEQLLLNFSFSTGISIIIFVPLYFIIMYFYMVIFMGVIISGGEASSLPVTIGLFIVFFIITLSVMSSATKCGNFFMSKQIFFGEKKNLGKAFTDAFKGIPKSLLAGMAKGIILCLSLLFLLPVVFFVNKIDGFEMVLLVIVCAIPCVLAYLVLDTLMVYADYVAINEGRLFFGAVIKGLSLIKESFFRTFGIRLLMQTLIMVLTYSLTFGVQFAVTLFADMSTNMGIMLLFIIFQYLLTFVISTLTKPLFTILDVTLYFNQKIKKDGLDLEIRLSRLERGIESGGGSV